MRHDRETAAVILAAGEGTRMKSGLAKVLHEICGRPMIEYVLEALGSISPSRTIVVVGHQAEAVRERLSSGCAGRFPGLEFVLQSERLGTGHAVMQARGALEGFAGTVMVLAGDTPLLRGDTLTAFVRFHRESGASATVMSAHLDDAAGYGRILRDGDGDLLGIVEHKDATEEERSIGEFNSGIFCFESDVLFHALERVDRRNVQGEYYLTDVMAILRGEGRRIAVYRIDNSDEVMGVNDRQQLGRAERMMKGDG
jgi:bifunctional UDP-N-acetylglucosamine pyrophosphorylase/glucosamine-1-phosphate N-acetyltransferase